MKNVRKIIVAVAVISGFFIGTNYKTEAATYYKRIMELKQPNASTVKVKVTGDEYYQQIESLDGYTLCRDEDGWICYADADENKDELVASDEVYSGENYKDTRSIWDKLFKNAPARSKHVSISDEAIEETRNEVRTELNAAQSEASESKIFNSYVASSKTKSADSKEEINGLTILIDFPDQKSSISKDEITNFVNKVGYTGYNNNGSVRDYFYDVSGGAIEYTNTVTDFYTAKYEKSYYDNVNSTDYGKALELVREALNNLKETGFDFSTLSVDSDGEPRAVNILYAGNADAGWSNGLWPHQGYVPEGFSSNGVTIHKYQLSNIGDELSLDTMCHEDGHLLFGFPDFYDYTGNSGGCGIYSIMSYISDVKNPTPPDPYCRNIISGWNNTVDLNSINNSRVEADSSENGTQTVYKWSSSSNSKEYYLIENIEKSGRYTSSPDDGLMIWHVDENGDNGNYEGTADKHYMLSVVQADDKKEIEKNINSGDTGDLFYAGYKDSFSYNTSPSSKWWNNIDSGLNISNISAKGKIMTFNVGTVSSGEDVKPTVYDSEIVDKTINYDNTIPHDVKVQVTLNGNKVSSIRNNNTALKVGSDYTLLDNGITFNKNYLSTLKTGSYKFEVEFSAGKGSEVNIYVSNPVIVKPDIPIEDNNNFDVSAKYSDSISVNTINTNLTIKTLENKSYDISKLKVRYYYTSDGNTDESIWIDTAALSYSKAPWYVSVNDSTKGEINVMDNAKSNADHYVEFSFTSNDTLDSTSILTIGARIAKNDWSSFDLSNDYSYKNVKGIVIYYDGEVVNGVEP